MFLETLGAAVLAAALALIGNYVLLRFQTRIKVREERRAFVRELHAETVDLVVDVDLFVRSLRASALTGTTNDDEQARVKETSDTKWEANLLPRVRRARFGHPDPDVRIAAERLDDEMWLFIVMAESPKRESMPFPPTKTEGERRVATENVETALVELRRSVYAAPHRDVPKINYTGEEIPSRFWSAVVADLSSSENEANPQG